MVLFVGIALPSELLGWAANRLERLVVQAQLLDHASDEVAARQLAAQARMFAGAIRCVDKLAVPVDTRGESCDPILCGASLG
jgi:hypothetical protein